MIRRHSRLSRWLALAVAGVLVAACGSPAVTGQASASGSEAGATPAAESSASPAASTTPAATPVGTPPGSSLDPNAVTLEIDVIAGGLASPVDVAAADDGSGRVFVVEQAGRIRLIQAGRLVTRPLLDIRERIASGGERGLLGLALHPDFPSDPHLFVDYTDVNGDTVVSEFRLDATDGDIADPDSERILIQIDQPFENHNGGAVAFGSDGMLYVSTGDGGSGGDPEGNGRRLDTLLAKILRIDVDGAPEGDKPYRIPADNPYLDDAEALPEIWLTGLRNPWRMRFDDATGDLWIGDVGQGAWEEIDVAPLTHGGLDFGWNVMEGTHCFVPSVGCDRTGLTSPVAEYGHDVGCAVIGGPVVRDSDQPLLDGGYLFSDSCSGTFWLLDASVAGSPGEPVVVLESSLSISSIALDEDGTVLATDLGGGQLVAVSAASR
jgi:glucose/arabinose dehydrogenase